MYIFFVDATDSRWIERLDSRHILHSGRIVKIFASQSDPRIVSGKKNLFCISRECNYEDTMDNFRGRLLDRGFNNTTVAYPITLFEFSKQMGFLDHFLMSKGYDTDPLDHLHGYKRATTDPWRIHIDVFTKEGISKLSRFVNIDNPEMVLTQREVIGSVFRHEGCIGRTTTGEVLI